MKVLGTSLASNGSPRDNSESDPICDSSIVCLGSTAVVEQSRGRPCPLDRMTLSGKVHCASYLQLGV